MKPSILNRIPIFISNPVKLFVRLKHKTKKNLEPDQQKVSPDIIYYLEKNPEYAQMINKIPKVLLRKYATPENMYLINKEMAKTIYKTIKNYLNPNSPLVEVNPGFCYLTEELLNHLDQKIYIYESSSSFNSFLDEIKKKYNDKAVCKIANFYGINKLAFQDKLDQGNRVRELLGELATEDQTRVLQIIGVMPGLQFMRYLTTLLFHHSTNLLGKVDLYVVMAAHHYEYLADSEIQTYKFRQIPALFQLIFDFKVMGRVPKLHYLPWTTSSFNKKVSVLDQDYMYIVNIKQKETLPCHSEYLPMLWYFTRSHNITKSTRVIPMLEQFLPGCGVWMITGQDPLETNKALGPNENDAQLPHMTIFTQYGDLNLAQKLTVFKKFISWPGFDQCTFKVTMENNLPKFITAADSDKEQSGIHIDADDESSDSDTES